MDVALRRDHLPRQRGEALQRAREVLQNDTVAVVGYGVQGPGQALNMRDNGVRVIVEGAEFADYFWPAAEQMVEMSHEYWRTNGKFVPNVTVRLASGGYIGGGLYHSQNVEGWLTTLPGIRIVVPAFADDDKRSVGGSYATQGGKGPWREDREDRREDRRDDRQDRREDRREDRQDWRADRRDDRHDWREDRREIREDRRDHRQDWRAERRDDAGERSGAHRLDQVVEYTLRKGLYGVLVESRHEHQVGPSTDQARGLHAGHARHQRYDAG